MVVLTDADADWLRTHYPELAASADLSQVAGTIRFSAAYDKATNGFSIVRAPGQRPPGELYACRYEITIRDGASVATRARLPRLLVENAPFAWSAERHCSGGLACLCGPSEEVAFASAYDFRQYLEELCIPFLYAQSYYSTHDRWPWLAYEHDATGALESYQASGNDGAALGFTINEFLARQTIWPFLRTVLARPRKPHGHMPCLCGSRKPIRACHSEAWGGLKKMYADVQRLNFHLP